METIKNLINKIKSNDKLAHLLVNLFIVVLFGWLFGVVIGLSLAIIASLCKETYDEFRPNGTGWDWKDIIADIIGILIGLFILL